MGFRVLDVCFPHCPLSPCSRETDKSSVPHLEDSTIKGRGEEVAEKTLQPAHGDPLGFCVLLGPARAWFMGSLMPVLSPQVQWLGDGYEGEGHHCDLLGAVIRHWPDPHAGLEQLQ